MTLSDIKLFAVFRNGKPEAAILEEEIPEDALSEEMFLLTFRQIVNIFSDESLAEKCKARMQELNPKDEFTVVKLLPFSEIKEWN